MRRALASLAVVVIVVCQAPVLLADAETATDAAHFLSTESAPALQPAVSDPTDPRAYIRARADRAGWRGRQWRCLDAILTAESHYRLKARNGRHVGIFQHATTPTGASLAKQTRLGLKYVAHRYGTPCAALHFRILHNWY